MLAAWTRRASGDDVSVGGKASYGFSASTLEYGLSGIYGLASSFFSFLANVGLTPDSCAIDLSGSTPLPICS